MGISHNYEGRYHKTLHEYLYNDNRYYELRSRLAYINYFKDIRDIKTKKILEFGCGLGQNIFWLSKLGISVKGYDISKFALNFCRKKGLNTSNSLDKEKFDIIFSRHVLEHLRNPFETLKMLNERLSNKGKIMLILPLEKNEEVSFKPDLSRHLYCWNFRTINNLLDEAGYKAIKNEVLSFAMGYNIFAFTSKISPSLYDFLTKLAGLLRGAKEMRIIAIKK